MSEKKISLIGGRSPKRMGSEGLTHHQKEPTLAATSSHVPSTRPFSFVQAPQRSPPPPGPPHVRAPFRSVFEIKVRSPAALSATRPFVTKLSSALQQHSPAAPASQMADSTVKFFCETCRVPFRTPPYKHEKANPTHVIVLPLPSGRIVWHPRLLASSSCEIPPAPDIAAIAARRVLSLLLLRLVSHNLLSGEGPQNGGGRGAHTSN